MSAPTSHPPRRPPLLGGLLWFALLLVTGTVGWLALGACGFAWREGRPIMTFCPTVEAAEMPPDLLSEEQTRTDELQRQLERLQIALATAPDCPEPLPELAAADPPPEPEPVPEIEEPPPEIEVAALPEPLPEPEAFDLPAHRPEPPPLPDPPPTPEPVAAPPPPLEDIPQDAWQEQDVSFLEGCWTLISHQTVHNRRFGQTRDISNWRICFDASGNGHQSMNIADGERCEGPVIARFNGDRLAMSSFGDMTCRNGRIPQIVQDCQRLPNGTAECVGSQPSANRWGIVSTFQR